ncbi:MAG: hypothetical protein RLZZ262_766, partial [Bacteroidota bacterium]
TKVSDLGGCIQKNSKIFEYDAFFRGGVFQKSVEICKLLDELEPNASRQVKMKARAVNTL